MPGHANSIQVAVQVQAKFRMKCIAARLTLRHQPTQWAAGESNGNPGTLLIAREGQLTALVQCAERSHAKRLTSWAKRKNRRSRGASCTIQDKELRRCTRR